MSRIFADRVLETTTTTGAGDITLAGAVTGFQRFDTATRIGATCECAILGVDGNGTPTGEWETGLYTYSATNTLQRTAVQDSSNSGAVVTFSAGTKQVMMTANARTVAQFAPSFLGTFAKWNAAKARGSSLPPRVLAAGDSVTAGEGSLGGTFPAGAFPHGFAHDFAIDMGWITGSIYGNQNIGNMAAFEGYNPTVSHSGGWSVATGGADILGGVLFISPSGSGGNFTWVPTQSFTHLKVIVPKASGLNGALTVTIDGSLLDTFTQAGTATMLVKDYTVSAGTHTVVIGCSGSGDAYIEALEISDSAGTPVFCQAGWSGGKAADMTAATNPWSALNELGTLAFDYVLYAVTINDAAAATAGDTYYKAVEAFIATAAATADGCLILVYPSDTASTLNGWLDSAAKMLRAIAVDYGWSFLDMRSTLGNSYRKANAASLAQDASHPNAAGHTAIQGALRTLLGKKL